MIRFAKQNEHNFISLPSAKSRVLQLRHRVLRSLCFLQHKHQLTKLLRQSLQSITRHLLVASYLLDLILPFEHQTVGSRPCIKSNAATRTGKRHESDVSWYMSAGNLANSLTHLTILIGTLIVIHLITNNIHFSFGKMDWCGDHRSTDHLNLNIWCIPRLQSS